MVKVCYGMYMKKIIIIGPSGAGKTVLAKKISNILSIPHIELDRNNHQENWQPVDKVEFVRTVRSMTSEDSWIFCGNYFSTLGIEFWKQADTIIWCDFSFPLVLGRLLRRTAYRILTRQLLWNSNRETFRLNFLSSDSVILWMMKSWNRQKKRYNSLFSKANDLPNIDLIRLKSPRLAAEFLDHIL
jgi:adenylate kinase family enzyme